MVVDLVSLAGRDSADAAGDCYWKFTTTDDRILVLSAAGLEQIETYIQVCTFHVLDFIFRN